MEDLMEDLKNKDIPKYYREKLWLVWFVHSVLLERDIRKVTEHDLLALADDFGKFNDYPWGYDNYYLTIKYLLKKLKPNTTILYSFTWAFMAWACEAIPPLRKYFKNYPDKVVYTWIVPTIDELGMTSFLTMGLVDTKENPMVELIKKELDGETFVSRAVRQDLDASSGGVVGGVVCNGRNYPAAASAASRDYEHVGAQEDKLHEKLEAIAEAVEKLKSRMVVIPSNKYVDEILYPMRGRQLAYPDAYDVVEEQLCTLIFNPSFETPENSCYLRLVLDKVYPTHPSEVINERCIVRIAIHKRCSLRA
ncbi:hypothetical protein FXO37_00797 [Capsicum annuum]|nr:hypothetical protein FXO37_00797 [Capsicum annuum]